MSPDDEDFDSKTRTTQELNPMDVHSWPIVLAGLEQLSAQLPHWDAVFALRLGTLQQIRGVLIAMCDPDASPDLVNSLRELVEALARMPWAVTTPADAPR